MAGGIWAGLRRYVEVLELAAADRPKRRRRSANVPYSRFSSRPIKAASASAGGLPA